MVVEVVCQLAGNSTPRCILIAKSGFLSGGLRHFEASINDVDET
jgi:hypothetical protein